MAEGNDLHARLLVLENDSKRHETDISQIWGRVSALEICAASLPQIQKSLESISSKVENLTNCSVKGEGEKLAFLTLREWFIVAIALGSLILTNFR